MTTLHDFAKVKDVIGVSEYVLVRQDGHIMIHDAKDHEALGQLAVLCGNNCDAIKADIPSRFQYFLFSRECGKHLMVFPVGGYYLGVVQASAVASSHVAETVSAFIRKLVRKSA
ncbi:MAG: hypothetical protein KKD73_12295 [Proteobacteria bacterium]|nr:hypothetical protein [Pseudomonadota bacterium]MBU1639998.1 hypothetical protein [Pseudomonadota bacterium]